MPFVGSKGKRFVQVNLRFVLGLCSNWILSMESRHDKAGYFTESSVKGRG